MLGTFCLQTNLYGERTTALQKKTLIRQCFIFLLPFVLAISCCDGFVISNIQQPLISSSETRTSIMATIEGTSSLFSRVNPSNILDGMKGVKVQAEEYASQFDLQAPEASLYALMLAMRDTPLGLHGSPFVLRNDAIQEQYGATEWPGFFTMEHLEAAVEEDFLDAARGSTDNRKGWQVRTFSCFLSEKRSRCVEN